MTALLRVENLRTYFHTRAGVVRAVDDVSFSINPGETLCFVCGPPALIGEIRPQLMELGVEGDQIRIENWA